MRVHDIQSSPPTLGQFVSDALRRQAETITDAWLAQLANDTPATPAGREQLDRLREQVPEVVAGLADFIRSPSDQSRAAVIDRLRLHTELRREQGYDFQQLLTEYELLSRLVFDAFVDAVRSYDRNVPAVEALTFAGRLRESLMEITSEAVGLYRKREREQQAELSQRLSTFAGVIAHELKNPLGAAQAGTQMLRDKDVITSADQQDRFTKLVLRNLVRVHDLIDEIRTLALAPDARGPERQTGIAQVVAKVFGELREDAAAKGVMLETDGRLPEAGVDAFRAEIILVNLIGNAIKYSDQRKTPRWVCVSAKPSGEGNGAAGWTVTVQDNGLGIPASLQSSVFHRHFRAHPEMAEGTGLGLAIAAEVTAAGGGRISFESDEGTGTSFHVFLPERRGRR